jgi:chemotaxis protein methyltransferase CheR
MRGDDCVAFLQWALPRMSMRWSGFRKPRGQVCKRIARRVKELGLPDFDAYRGYLQANPDEWQVLDTFCRVTISRFHRDKRVFELIRGNLLPGLARIGEAGPGGLGTYADGALRFWSAGCASGEEPYTLSIMWQMELASALQGIRLEVVATDADATMLNRARRACYPSASLRELPEQWVDSAFERAGEEMCLRPSFREGVELLQQDIREEMPAGPFHLILCRNLVFTYFNSGLQIRILGELLERLAPGGYLILGAHESLPEGEWPLERVDTGAEVFIRR